MQPNPGRVNEKALFILDPLLINLQPSSDALVPEQSL